MVGGRQTLNFFKRIRFLLFYILVSFYLMVHPADLKTTPSLTDFFYCKLFLFSKPNWPIEYINVQSRIKLMIKLT